MLYCRIYGEFASEELAELTAGRIRRAVRGISRMTIKRLGKGMRSYAGRERFTMLPANLRMMNYATDVMISPVSSDVVPEPFYRCSSELLVICTKESAGRVTALMQAMGAVRIRRQNERGSGEIS